VIGSGWAYDPSWPGGWLCVGFSNGSWRGCGTLLGRSEGFKNVSWRRQGEQRNEPKEGYQMVTTR